MNPDHDSLVVAYLPMVRAIARRYARRYEGLVEQDELESLGRLEMCRKVADFDPGYGLTFGAWVRWSVVERLKRAVRAAARRTRWEPGLRWWVEGPAAQEMADAGLLADGTIAEAGEQIAPADARKLVAHLLADLGPADRAVLLQAVVGQTQALATVRRRAGDLRARLAAIRAAAQGAFPEPGDHMTTAAAAELLGVSDRMVRKMVRAGRLAAVPASRGRWKILAWSVELASVERRRRVKTG